jgi:hypothetical protein
MRSCGKKHPFSCKKCEDLTFGCINVHIPASFQKWFQNPISHPIAALSCELKCSRTKVYAPLSIRGTLVEHIYLYYQDVKSRFCLAGLSNAIWGFEITSRLDIGIIIHF